MNNTALNLLVPVFLYFFWFISFAATLFPMCPPHTWYPIGDPTVVMMESAASAARPLLLRPGSETLSCETLAIWYNLCPSFLTGKIEIKIILTPELL